MRQIIKTFLGSGAARRIGLGFVPRKVVLTNITDTAFASIVWTDRHAGAGSGTVALEGLLVKDNSKLTPTALTYGAGIQPYFGGSSPLSASAVTDIVDASKNPLYASDMRNKGTLGLVTRWTLDTSGNRTGHFNKGVNTTYVGVGSRLFIKGDNEPNGGNWYTIVAITNDGDAADEITLDRAAPSGDVQNILYRVDLAPAPIGLVMPAGIVINETADVNASNEIVVLEAYGDPD